MDNLNEIQLGTKRIFEGKMINLRVDTVRLPNSKEAIREVVEHPGAVAVVPILPDGRVIMVRQYRYPIKQNLLEIPAGKLDKNEQPEDCAIRELEEETGYCCGRLRHLTSIWTAPGFSDEVIHIYAAEDLIEKKQQLDDDEFLQVEIYNKDDLQNMIRNGIISDSKTVIGLCMIGITP